MRFLIVDDSSMMRRVLSIALAKLGHAEIIEACGGRDALHKLSQETVDVIITDWQMPDMSGLELVRLLRNSSATRHTPIMMVTSNARSNDVVEALKSGVDGYVVKPFTLATIREKVATIMAR